MKNIIKPKQFLRSARLLMLFACFTLAHAQATGTVIPTVCFEAKPETFTRTLTSSVNINGMAEITPSAPPGLYRIVFNPGNATEESLSWSFVTATGTTVDIQDTGFPSQSLLHPHAPGETILLTTDGTAVFGYNNLSGAAVNIPRGVSSHNYFAPGAPVYTTQPSLFQPGIHENVTPIKVIAGFNVTWFLQGREAKSTTGAEQGCATITYQGRLSDAGAAANGQFDLQFQAFETETGGAAQSELITIENAQVTNGVFTVSLRFGSTLINNFKARFLEIGVRAGSETGAFNILTPRQPVTQVPFAVNAQTAQTAFDVRLQLVVNAPPSTECNETGEHGRMKADAINNKLWVCTATGWKSTVLQ